MAVIVNVIPDDKSFVCENSRISEGEFLLTQLDYEYGYEIYKVKLTAAMNGLTNTYSFVPSISMKIINSENNEEIVEKKFDIVFDGSLYKSLYEIYILEGWDYVLHIGEEINNQFPKITNGDNRGDAIIINNIWTEVKSFYNYAKFLLAKNIYAYLKIIERKSATQIQYNLNEFSSSIEKSWEIDFNFQLVDTPMGLIYNCKNKKKSNELFIWLTEYVSLRDKLQQANNDTDKLKAIEYLFQKIHELEKAGTALIQLNNATRTLIEILLKNIEELIKGLKENQEDSTKKLSNLFESRKHELMAVIYSISPIGVLLINELEFGFLQTKMENTLALIINNFYEKRDELKNVIHPEKSNISEYLIFFNNITTNKSDVLDNWKLSQTYELPKEGVEQFFVDKSLSLFSNQLTWFPLLAEETLNKLVSLNTIQKDSFDYIVYIRYMIPLQKELQEIKNTKETLNKIIVVASKVASLFSLMLLLTPDAPATLATKTAIQDVSTGLFTILLSSFVVSIPIELSTLDKNLKKELMEFDDKALEQMAKIGEILKGREDYLERLTWDTIILLLNFMPVTQIKKILHLYNYYLDIETVLS